MENFEKKNHQRELAVMRLGELVLAVPLSELQSLDPVLDVVLQDARSPSVGYVVSGESRLPVFSLDSELRPNSAPATGQRICALLGEDSSWFGLVCESIDSLVVSASEDFSVPGCMSSPESPIENLLVRDGAVICATTAGRLVEYLERDEFSEKRAAVPLEASSQ